MTTAQPALSNDSTDNDHRWERVRVRDKSADGTFYFAVQTTGVVCRPGCPARTPLRKNVRFFDTLAAALREGFRPCRRCRPDRESTEDRHRRLIARACRQIESPEANPSLAELAQAAGMSPAHFHRLFKRLVGLTPKQYATGVRNRRLRHALDDAGTVTRAMYEAGFGSSASFYANAEEILGMSPGAYRSLGAGESVTYAVSSSSVGLVLVATTQRGICMVAFGDSAEELVRACHERFRLGTVEPGGEEFSAVVEAVIEHIDHPGRQPLELPLDIRGTAFQHRVWHALRQIPPAETRTYSEIARDLGTPDAARAVAGACASNELAVVVPCHRVVRADGKLGGYRWGLERKQALLDRERESAPSRD